MGARMEKRVLVLGGSGMLGSMVADYLSRDADLYVGATARDSSVAASCRERLGRVEWHALDAAAGTAEKPAVFEGIDWVINCIGIIKPLIHDDNASEVERALRINALFPHLLSGWTEGRARVLQIATDCVYSGTKGHYAEADPHDALDVYGKTKSLGEVYSSNVHHLRCSIIGPEAKAPKSLLEWVLNQPPGASVNGFVNHNWNGVTTLHFAKLCGGIIKNDRPLPHAQHVIPSGHVTKCEMLQHFARCYARDDITVRPTEAATVIDRTLATNGEPLNRELWESAGYAEPPSVPQMVEELAQFDYRAKVRGAARG
jgi:dTDP-4-dehydrorhamnose reductase